VDAHLLLKSKTSVIGSASDFAYKWSLNVGLDSREAARLALAVDEVVSNVVSYAFVDEEGEFEVVFRSDLGSIEVVVREQGEPFDPDRHRYDRDRAVKHGDFKGAGIELARHFVDDFVFLNKGKAGKEFRIVKHIVSQSETPVPTLEPTSSPPRASESYFLAEATPSDSEDIAKLMFRTYGYTYANDEMYQPDKIARGFERDKKFGVIVRSQSGEATGYFAVLRMADSSIGEVAEVVVSPGHRRKGLMTRMLTALIDRAKEEQLRGLFGEAVAVHEISQRVNHKLGFHSTALLLADLPITRYRKLIEEYPQDISAVIDFLFIDTVATREVYLPLKYRNILAKIYRRQGVRVTEPRITHPQPADKTRLDVDIAYHNHNAVVVVRRFGRDFRDSVVQTAKSLREQGINTVYVDLPLDNPFVGNGVKTLDSLSYLFAGLMPLFHDDRDYLRMQHTHSEMDMDRIITYSPTANEIKKRISSEMRWITKRQLTS
jgi:anti-sigma regulatory factor (Ser/Thr protein kinase)/RimJ/RimL family protein N-acetyltransferase